GKSIQESLEGRQQPAMKPVEHAYLEHWLKTNNLDAQFFVARFYESINDLDRIRLAVEGKVLVFSSGSEGYFTDPTTAQLMTQGSEQISPIYASTRNSPHNAVAYGGLIASDGVASTALASARILVIDDERRTHGDAPLLDQNGRTVSAAQLALLYDKMGDGTMLVSEYTMRALQTVDERDSILIKTAKRAGVSGDISTLAQESQRADAALAAAEEEQRKLAHRSVVQFRAASPELPGVAKGTVSSSQWCDRLGVDAIISRNDIKGDDGRLSTPGVRVVSNFWINRKAISQYGQQSVGPQVKYCIPEATRLEINPQVQTQAEKLAQVAGDFSALSQRYVAQKAEAHQRPYQDNEVDPSAQATRLDWLYDVLSADKYGQLAEQAGLVRGLSRYAQGEWKRLATNGTSVPSAMAQHHAQLKPWEVCNKDLPNGAIVAYYRSPFPNVGAAAVAINNTEVIRVQDKEAFSKQGVAYLPPWTAKNIAITDFDGDINGFFVGYRASVSDLPQQIRAELATVGELLPAQQYEAGRVVFERMIQQLEQGQESRIAPDEHPLAVKEFAERNAPEVRPPEIVKQPKEKHPWRDGESYSAAVWRAWGVTADNLIGKVANAGMSLQALALEMQYAPIEKRDILLEQLSKHFTELLVKVDKGEISLPSDDWLTEQGFSPFYRERMEEIVKVGQKLESIGDIRQRRAFAGSFLGEQSLYEASAFLSEVANGPNAVNLQTAVDMAKSAKGIDEELHQFVKALQYKPDVLRQSKNNPELYLSDKTLPANTQEPIAWGIQSVNAQYSEAQLEERLHQAFQGIFPKANSKQQVQQAKAITENYNSLMAKALKGKSRHQQRRAEDQRPTMVVTLPDGRQFTLQNIQDHSGKLPIWRADGQQPDWTIRVKQDHQATHSKERFPAQLIFVERDGTTQSEHVGYVSVASAIQHDLARRLQEPDKKLSVTAPTVTMQVPWAQENDTDMLFEQAARYLASELTPPAGKVPAVHRQEMAIALWRHHSGRHLVLKQFSDVVGDRLSRAPASRIGRLQIAGAVVQRLIDKSPHTIQFAQDRFFDKQGKATALPSVSVVTPAGDRFLIGAVAGRCVALPPGATYMAAFSKNAGSDKVVDMQVMDLPVIVQSPAEMTALPDGRRHLTFDYEPHAVYGVRTGDIVVAQVSVGGEQVALRVGEQHLIDEQLALKHTQRWSEAEQVPTEQLLRQLSVARNAGKALWGLNVEPLGTYRQGQIATFQPSERQQQRQWAQSIASGVRRVYDELPKQSGNAVEVEDYRIAFEPQRQVLILQARNGQELARFSTHLDQTQVISAEGLSAGDFERWNTAIEQWQSATAEAAQTGAPQHRHENTLE
ncbi:MAG: hypothetical protein WBA01_08680, partial [Phormidesmis sp.]